MSTYQHGQQPDGAPVTWEKWGDYYLFRENGVRNGFYVTSEKFAERTARAFHLAKLAEEAAYMLRKSTDKDVSEWLDRYRETVR